MKENELLNYLVYQHNGMLTLTTTAMNFLKRLNFSQIADNTTAIKLHNRNRDMGYYYDNLCLYCANNGIVLDDVSNDEFDAAAEIMSQHAKNDPLVDSYYFWVDKD